MELRELSRIGPVRECCVVGCGSDAREGDLTCGEHGYSINANRYPCSCGTSFAYLTSLRFHEIATGHQGAF